MTVPHHSYEDCWESTLAHFEVPRCDLWPAGGVCPDWWPIRSAHLWPYEQPQGAKRRISTDAEALEMLTQSLSVEPTASCVTWARLGPRGNRSGPDETLTHLHHLTDWDLTPDGGKQPTRKLAGAKDDIPSQEATGAKRGKRAKTVRHPRMLAADRT
jgi:hypothetical protein